MSIIEKHSVRSLLFIILFLLISIPCEAQQRTNFNPPDWSKNAIIYEVNVRQFTDSGTFKEFENHLPELKKLGVDILWLMPINPIGVLNRKGGLGSYYSVRDFKKINPEFGTLEDFKNLVAKIHQNGMRVIIDWVANHTSWDNEWTKTHPEFYNKDSDGNFFPPVADWSDVIDLNYDNKELWNYMIDAMEYWVKECNIDGFRCDVAAMVPIEFWIDARMKLSKTKNLFMLAEASESFLHQAFDMTYNWQLKDLMNEIAVGKKDATDIIKYYESEKRDFNKKDYRMVFTSNHDENTWNGTEFERLGVAAESFAVLCGTISGMPLIYNGQETAMNKRLRFFEKDTIEWKPDRMREIYSKLNNLKKNNKALWNGIYGGEVKFIESNNRNVLGFIREKDSHQVFALFNLSHEKQTVELKNTPLCGNYLNLFDSQEIKNFEEKLSFDLKPWQYFIYTK